MNQWIPALCLLETKDNDDDDEDDDDEGTSSTDRFVRASPPFAGYRAS